MKTNERDPVNVTMGWAITTSLFILMILIVIISPLTYLWIMGTVGILGTMVGTCIACHGLMSGGGFIGFFLVGDVVKLGFEIIGAILSGLAEASK